jgi:hypothetical protein
MRLIKELTQEEKIDFAKKEWKDISMQEYLLKNYDYYKTSDNIIIEIEKPSHLSIRKTIWYDDELPAEEIPTASYENFILNNEKNCNRYDCYLEELNKKTTTFYFCNQGNVVSYIDYDRYEDVYHYGKLRYGLREITKEEMDEILKLYKEQKEAYLKRLERYYKRYSDHIYTEGYWRDR